jgi:hypothetical protein
MDVSRWVRFSAIERGERGAAHLSSGATGRLHSRHGPGARQGPRALVAPSLPRNPAGEALIDERVEVAVVAHCHGQAS